MKRMLRAAVPTAVVIASLTGAPAASSARERDAQKTATVTASGGPISILWAWTPDSVTISRKGTVVWENPTSVPHNVTAYEGDWEGTISVAMGTTAKRKFKKPGTYLYRCTVTTHSELAGGRCIGMCGEVVVE